jgi:hypothetical protein
MRDMEHTWIRVGGISGVFSVIGFLLVWMFFSIPIGGILFVTGLGSLMRLHQARVLTQIATLLGIIGFSIMNLMAVVQYVIDIFMGQGVPAGKDKETREMVSWVAHGVKSVQLGMGSRLMCFF